MHSSRPTRGCRCRRSPSAPAPRSRPPTGCWPSCPSGARSPGAPTAGTRSAASSGTWASSKMRANIAPPEIAVRGSGLRITALPSASAGATARIARMVGTLNGAITPTTPAGDPAGEGQPGRAGAEQLSVRVRRECRSLVALLGAGVHLEIAEGLDRPGLPGQPALDLLGVGDQGIARAPQDGRAFLERQRRPRPLGVHGAQGGGVDVVRRRLPDLAEHLPRRRLDGVVGTAAAVGPGAGPDLALPGSVVEQRPVVSFIRRWEPVSARSRGPRRGRRRSGRGRRTASSRALRSQSARTVPAPQPLIPARGAPECSPMPEACCCDGAPSDRRARCCAPAGRGP